MGEYIKIEIALNNKPMESYTALLENIYIEGIDHTPYFEALLLEQNFELLQSFRDEIKTGYIPYLKLLYDSAIENIFNGKPSKEFKAFYEKNKTFLEILYN